MIDEALQARLATLGSEAEQRALVQRVMNLLGVIDPPKIVRCTWEGKSATLYSWGETVLVGGRLLPVLDVHDFGDGRFGHCPPLPVNADVQHPLLKRVTDGNRAAVMLAIATFNRTLQAKRNADSPLL